MYRPDAFLCALLIVLMLLGASSAATGAVLSPGDVLVANDVEVHHYSASGLDLGVFTAGLSNASWMTVDEAGNVYVSEYTGNRVRKFSPLGVNLLTITTSYTPGGVAIGGDGTIYVAHYDAGRIHHYSATGDDLGIFVAYGECANGCGTDFIKFDADGNLYVGDFQPVGRIRLISPTGVDLGNFVTVAGVEGLAFDSSGNLYVSNNLTGIIQKYSPSGADLGPFASPATYGIAFDSLGNLWSSTGSSISGINRIEKFSPTGEDLGGFGVPGRDLAIVPGPVTVDQCKSGGWRTVEFPRIFKNQGDCIGFVNDGRSRF
jgi:sugar lactone lactonase YvrE